MFASAIDSVVFRDLFSTAAMRAVFSDAARLQWCLDVEAALARVEARLGIIPEEAAREIARHCDAARFDLERLGAETVRVGSPVLPIVRQLAALCERNLGEWCHWGATTQDITDTATVLQLRAALALIETDLGAICDALAGLARRHRDTPMAGRSKLQQATPITFGYKCAVLLAGFRRMQARLGELRPRVLVGEFGGATGTLAALGADGLAVQQALLAELGLAQPEIAWHTVRDRIAEVGCFLGLLAGLLGKVALDVRLLMQTEVAEVAEPYHAGRGGSSTMPQKRNPIGATYIHAATALVRQHVAVLLEAMVQDHERASGAWEIEWVVLPEICCLTAGALDHAKAVLGGLVVDPERMRRNLDLTGGLTQSEAVMMGLGPRLGRQRAHDLLEELCHAALAGQGTLLDLLAAHAEIAPHASREQIAAWLDPANYTGLAGAMVDRVLGAP
jgi:3-carboxy-cis,cis-muconate cycloisomerase